MPGISLDDRNAWDDTALIHSWDKAVAEYKKYYSIQAQGKRLEDVLTDEELRELRREHGDLIEEEEIQSTTAEADRHADQIEAEHVVEEMNGGEPMDQDAAQAQELTASGHHEPSMTEPLLPQHGSTLAASMSQAILGTVQDENLKNLMMSWYYAGYYTGLYTGQQQATSNGTQRKEG